MVDELGIQEIVEKLLNDHSINLLENKEKGKKAWKNSRRKTKKKNKTLPPSQNPLARDGEGTLAIMACRTFFLIYGQPSPGFIPELGPIWEITSLCRLLAIAGKIHPEG